MTQTLLPEVCFQVLGAFAYKHRLVPEKTALGIARMLHKEHARHQNALSGYQLGSFTYVRRMAINTSSPLSCETVKYELDRYYGNTCMSVGTFKPSREVVNLCAAIRARVNDLRTPEARIKAKAAIKACESYGVEFQQGPSGNWLWRLVVARWGDQDTDDTDWHRPRGAITKEICAQKCAAYLRLDGLDEADAYATSDTGALA
jgi:hypothetical protein